MAARQAAQNRIVRAGWSAARTTFGHTAKILHLLFLEVAGVFFLAFAVAGAFGAWREYRRWSAGQIGPAKMYLGIAFAALFLWFAVSSFWRARTKT